MTLVAGSAARPLQHRPLAQLIEREARRHRNRILGIWIGVLGSALLGAGAYYALRPQPPALSARFRTQAVSRGDVVREVHATGHAEALITVMVGAEISGRIASVEVDFNEQVREGQVLARFDRAALQAQLSQTAAAAASARTALEQAETELAQTARVRERTARLYGQGSAPAAELDAADANARLAEQRVQAAQAQVAAQAAALALARTNLTHAEIRSPIDGIVITRNIDPGQSVASVLQAPTLFTVAADLRVMRVVAAVDEADIGEIRAGQVATFSVSAYPDRTFQGTVVEVRNSPVVLQDVVTYGTVIRVDNLDLALKPGMTASVRIRTARADGAVRVPNTALHFNPPGAPARTTPGVWVLEQDRLRHLTVRAGVSDGELTAIEGGELAPGTQVIVELTPLGRTAYGIGS